MSSAIFPFRFLKRGFREFLAFETAVHEQTGGRRITQKIHAAGELVVKGRILFPNPGGTYASFEAFWSARFGAFDSFLYKPQNPGSKSVHEDPTIDSASQTDFTLWRRYVDTATLVVKKNGTTQTLGTHYTLQNGSGGAYVLGTSPRCVVRFVTAPGTGADLDFDYQYYLPVRFEGDALPEDADLLTGGTGGATVADRVIAVALRECGPGFSYADSPNAL